MEGVFPPTEQMQQHLDLPPRDSPAVHPSQSPLEGCDLPFRVGGKRAAGIPAISQLGSGSALGSIYCRADPEVPPAPCWCRCQLTWGSFLLENGAEFPPNIPVSLPLHLQLLSPTQEGAQLRIQGIRCWDLLVSHCTMTL